ncbi:MAG: hypothetical protein HFG92_03240 [Dorea sp.]|nr:hypothetical protein [Dorea sp.]
MYSEGICRERKIRVLGMPGPCEHEEAADQRICSGAYGASALRRQLHDVAGSEAER